MPLHLKKPDNTAHGINLACAHLEATAAEYIKQASRLEAILAAEVARHGSRTFGIEKTRQDINDLLSRAGLLREQSMSIKELK